MLKRRWSRKRCKPDGDRNPVDAGVGDAPLAPASSRSPRDHRSCHGHVRRSRYADVREPARAGRLIFAPVPGAVRTAQARSGRAQIEGVNDVNQIIVSSVRDRA